MEPCLIQTFEKSSALIVTTFELCDMMGLFFSTDPWHSFVYNFNFKPVCGFLSGLFFVLFCLQSHK